MTIATPAPAAQPQFGPDNWTNWFYLLRTHGYLALVIGLTAWFYAYRYDQQLCWAWLIPVTLVACFLIGAGQHQLWVLAQEAAHRLLFRNKYLNDLASDWLCLYPMLSCTQHLRTQELSHHQFVNDPERDRVLAQLRESGHWPAFPLTIRALWRLLLRQLWLPCGLRYNKHRARFQGTGDPRSPYLYAGWQPTLAHVRVGIIYLFGMGLLLVGLALYGDWLLLTIVPAVAWFAIMLFYWWVPEQWYYQCRLAPVLSWRLTSLMRMTFITLVFCSLAWLTVLLGRWAVLYYATLWWLPLNTTFTLFMLFRHVAQHGNAGRGASTSTRNLNSNALVRWFCFPLGQDRHQAHHLHPHVTHFQLTRVPSVNLAPATNLIEALRLPAPASAETATEDVSVLVNESLLPPRVDG